MADLNVLCQVLSCVNFLYLLTYYFSRTKFSGISTVLTHGFLHLPNCIHFEFKKKKSENVLISIKRDFPKVARLNTSQEKLVFSQSKKLVSAKCKKSPIRKNKRTPTKIYSVVPHRKPSYFAHFAQTFTSEDHVIDQELALISLNTFPNCR